MPLAEYRRKRHFRRTPEPSGGKRRGGDGHLFVVQKHDATRLHYDFRLEHDGVLKSWAVPKGPSLDPATRRLAVEVEDHPLEYGEFEGVIPAGEYGAGPVELWDRGTWEPEGDVERALAKGHLRFRLEGSKLHGGWSLVRTRSDDGGKPSWLLIKRDDEAADPERDLLAERPESVASGRAIEEIAARPTRSWRGRDASARARGRALPKAPAPELATLVAQPPRGDGWLHELKLDGYRILAAVAGGRVRLTSRNGKDWTAKFPTVAAAVASLPVDSGVFDGEVVALDPEGKSSFQRLQRSLKNGSESGLVYFVFDLLELDGERLARRPLAERKQRLATLLRGSGLAALRYGDHVEGDAAGFYRRACAAGAEGIVSKRVAAPYRPGRGRDWLKCKCLGRQEVVVVGFTDPSGSRRHIGALLLGVHEDGELRYAGKVGTGFDAATLADLHDRLAPLERKTPPLADPPTGAERRGAHWVTPRLVAEVSFTEWTDDGRLRHPSFLGLREDKAADEVVRERPAPAPAVPAASPKPKPSRPKRSTERSRSASRASSGSAETEKVVIAGVTLSHPDRVLYPEQGITKQRLAEYYASVAERILPHLRDRVLSFVRCPGGREQCFFQKHLRDEAPAAVRSIEVRESSGGVERYHFVRDLAGIVALVQLGVLEIHGWQARADRVERPDRIVFDLDPAPGLAWSKVVDGAREVRARLEAIGLESWPLSTGGKGLHVVAPIERRSSWDDVRAVARALATAMERDAPARYLSKASKSERKGKVFVDWLRNGRGATAIVPYSTRARAGAPVAVPLRWSELARFRPGSVTVESLARRLARQRSDPWEEMLAARQALGKVPARFR